MLNNLQEGDVLFVDEIHRLNRQVEEVLYPAMEDFAIDIMIGKGAAARSIRLDLPHFTLVGATTRAGLLTAPLKGPFWRDSSSGILYRRRADNDYLQILRRCWDVEIDARRSTGAGTAGPEERQDWPTVFLKRVRDFAQVKYDGENYERSSLPVALDLLEVDTLWIGCARTGRSSDVPSDR